MIELKEKQNTYMKKLNNERGSTVNNLVGKKVKNQIGVEQLVLEVVKGTYCIRTQDRSGDFNTYTKEGYFSKVPNSRLSLVVDSEGNIVTFDGWEEEVTKEVSFDGWEEEVTVTEEVSLPIFKEEILSSMGLNPYEASLKNARVELSTEITGLIENNSDISEILSKLKILKKLVEL